MVGSTLPWRQKTNSSSPAVWWIRTLLLGAIWSATRWYPTHVAQVHGIALAAWLLISALHLLGGRRSWCISLSALASTLFWGRLVWIAGVTANLYAVAFFVEIALGALQGSAVGCVAPALIGMPAIVLAARGDPDPGATRAAIVSLVALLSTSSAFHLLVRRARRLSAAGSALEEVAFRVHGVKNSLSGVAGFAELLAQDLPEDDPRQAFARRIREGLDSAHDRLTKLLEPTPESGAPAVDGNSLLGAVECAVASSRALLERQNVRWRIDLSDSLVSHVPREALTAVIGELIQNSIRVMPNGGQLTFTARTGPLRLLIHDTGCGIPAPLRQRVFEARFTMRPGGHGLGLAGVQRTLSRYGGTVRITDIDHGTEFELVLEPPRAPSRGGAA